METTRETVRTMPLVELRARVEEAEKLLRVAKQLARDQLADPQQSSRARDRIGSIVSEVQGLFPGLGESDEAEVGFESDPGEDADAESNSEEEEEEEEWELDCDKLRAALANDALMSQIPETERPRFRAMAEQLLEVHERGELYARILMGFEELAEVTRVGAETVQRQLATMLTFGGASSLSDLASWRGEPVERAQRAPEADAIAAMLVGTPRYKA